MHQSKEILQHQVQLTVHLLESLGFIINGDKSQLDPSQEIQFLGFQTNEVLPSGGENTRHCSSLPGDSGPGKVVNSTTVMTFGQVKHCLPSGPISPNTLPSTAAVLSAPICYRQLQQLKIQSLKRSRLFDTLVTLDQRAVEELLWWKDQLRNWNGRDIVPPPPDINRCLQHWLGSSVSRSQDRRTMVPAGASTAHKCSRVDSSLLGSEDICERQPQGLDAYPFENGQCLSPNLCQSDGGTCSPELMRVACSLWDWCLQRGITLSASRAP